MEKKNIKNIFVLIGILTVLLVALAVSVFVLVAGKKEKPTGGNDYPTEQESESTQVVQNEESTEEIPTETETSVTETQTEEIQTEENQTTWNPDSLRNGLNTVIEYDKQYMATVPTKEEAAKAIRDYGSMQREKYSNPSVEAIERQIEEEYGIFAVNLGEMEEATALDVQRAVAYMFKTYPQIRGTLTNITLGNFNGQDAGNIAVTQSSEFMLSGEPGQCPYVVKYEIVLNAAKFTQREKMLGDCAHQVSIGHWPENTDISSIVVHELGHHLLDVSIMEQYGLKDGYYITEENEDAYISYSSDKLAANQATARRIMEEAYKIWQEEYGHSGKEEEFRKSISDYAMGIQADGGISYGETFAEAVADVYLNSEEASDASKAIIAVINNKIL